MFELSTQTEPSTKADRPGRRRPIPWIERLVASATVRAGYASVVGHVVLLALLGLWFIEPPRRFQPRPIILTLPDHAVPEAGSGDAADTDVVAIPAPLSAGPPLETPDAVQPADPAVQPPAAGTAAAAAGGTPAAAAAATDVAVLDTPPLVTIPDDATAAFVTPTTAAPVTRPASLSRRTGPSDDSTDDPYAGRSGAARAAAARSRGGSAASEAAVERGLAWLVIHQAADGSWRFDLSACRCDGACRDPGTVPSTTASTGLALLAFLGAGHTHVAGGHQEAVGRGLYYLMSRQRATTRGGDLGDGTMYGHGVAAFALAEALGMTRDDMLARPVADAVRFIATAQDMHGGGWRYLPGQAGDTTVSAWQLAALKSAALAGVGVPSPTIDGVCRFLDRVQARGGEAYGYLGPQPKPCTSAIGLFCRLHTGWANRAALDRGLAALARPGPEPTAVYQNFYLAQALLQAEHPAWPRWNGRNRDQLVARQATLGHEQGSWFFEDPDTAPGGRLAHTALAVLTLEVYYRLLPIYRPDAVDMEP